MFRYFLNFYLTFVIQIIYLNKKIITVMKQFKFIVVGVLLIVLSVLIITNLSTQSIQKETYSEVPQKLQGFWQFDVDEEGSWNGMHIGKTYIEVYYELAEIQKITKKGNEYTLEVVNSSGRDKKIVIKPINDNNAIFILDNNKEMTCKRFDTDPDIEVLPVSEYTKVIKGKWIIGNDTRNVLAIDKDELLWDGEKWKIHWLGEYLQKEFRALIQKKNRYELIYITPIDEKKKKVVFARNTQYYRPMPLEKEQNKLYGTWCDSKTNEWIIGFFDKIAVYKNQSWFYKILSQNKNTYTVKLQKGNKKRTLSLSLISADKCQLTDGTTTKNLFYTLHPLAYKYPDKKPFANNHYKMDTVTINGYLQNIPNREEPFSIGVHNFIKEDFEEFYSDIDKNGCFTIKFPVLNTSEIFIDWRRAKISDVVEPGETYFLYIDYTGKGSLQGKNTALIWQMGENARLHREIISDMRQNLKNKSYASVYHSTKKHDDFLKEHIKTYKENQKYTAKYIANNPMLSERFKLFRENKNLFELARDLMQRSYRLNRPKKERFSKFYMQKVDSIFKLIPKPYTLCSSINGFLKDYFRYYEPDVSEINVSIPHPLNEIEKQKLYFFTEEEKAVCDKAYKARQRFLEVMKSKKDSVYKARQSALCIKDFNNKKYNLLVERVGYILTLKEYLDIHKQFLDGLIIPQDFRDLLNIKYAFSKKFETDSQFLYPFQMNFLDKEIKNENLKNILQKEQQKLLKLDGKAIEYAENLKRTDHLKDAKTADELLRKITKPYLGKVIYIDIWGTWCGPCKMQMKYAKKVKKALKGKDIVFMYLANRSPERVWKNIIKRYELIGKNIIHYNLPKEQQAMLERRLGVHSYPSYFIMDKKGNMVDMKPAVPSQTEGLIRQLNAWIEK